MPLRAVLLDLDETLIPEEEPLLAGYRAVAGDGDGDGALALRDAARARWAREAPCPEFRASVQVGASDGLSASFAGDGAPLAAIRAYLPHFRATVFERPELVEVWRRARFDAQTVYPGALELLGALGSRFRLALVTNGPSDLQRRKLAITGLAEHFDVVVASGDIGAGKPDPAIFAAALAALGAAPSEAVMIGNDRARDIDGAAAAGIRGIWVQHGGAEGAVGDLAEVARHEHMFV